MSKIESLHDFQLENLKSELNHKEKEIEDLHLLLREAKKEINNIKDFSNQTQSESQSLRAEIERLLNSKQFL